MANTPDVTECAACRRQGDARLPIDPWRSLAVHFGMLLGAADFETIDAYHRGKMWLHSAWLHREGVVWGLRPSVVEASGELRIEAGLAIDACGRELHLDRAACIDLGKWFAARVERLFAGAAASDPSIALTKHADGRVTLDAHVRMRFVGCLDRQVPALLEPCDGAGRTTAYSRVVETVELELAPGLPEPIAPAYPRLRMLFGIDPSSDDEVDDARATIAALPLAEQPAALEQAFRRFAALDAAKLRPASEGEGRVTVLPAIDPAWFTLALVRGLTLRPKGETWELDDLAELAWDQRPTHVATRPLQELVAANLAARIEASVGPRILRASVKIHEKSIVFQTSAALDEATLGAKRISLSALVLGAGWKPVAINAVKLASTGTKVEIEHDAVPDKTLSLRLRVDGTSATPVLGVEGWPLAGADDDPPTPAHAGRDFVHMHRRAKELQP